MHTPTDEQIMCRLQAGEEDDFRLLIRRYKGQLLSFAGPYCKWDMSLAAEMVQDIFVKVYEKRHAYGAGRPFRPWFYSLARNCILDRLRVLKRERGRTVGVDYDPTDPAAGPDAELFNKESTKELISLLAGLPEKQREVLDLVRQGFSYREISRVVGISEVAVRNNLLRGIRRLRKRVTKGRVSSY